MSFIENNLWVEKYRPRNINDLVINDMDMDILKKVISKREPVNFLFYGPAGTGKTTTARIIIDKLLNDKDNAIILNGSQERGIDILRNKLTKFLSSVPFSDDKYKIVFIDEADYLSRDFLAALRHFIEKYTDIGRFIFTCNYLYKIPDPIQSRFQLIEMKPLEDDYIKNYCINILKNENIEYNEDDINLLINLYKPDIRTIIQNLQKYSINNKLILPDFNKLITKEKRLASLTTQMLVKFQENNVSFSSYLEKIQSMVLDTTIDLSKVFIELFNDEKMPVYIKVKVNKYANELSSTIYPPMHYMSFIYESMKLIKESKSI